MLRTGPGETEESLRPFWVTLVLVNLSLVTAGFVLAGRFSVEARFAVPIVAAFLLAASFLLVPGFPAARGRLERRFAPFPLASLLLAASLAPYLTYALPCGVFSWEHFAFLAILYGVIAYLFAWSPPRVPALCWQDGVVMAALAWPSVSGLGSPFEAVFLTPTPAVRDLDFLGKLTLIPLGAMTFLSLRRLPHTGYRFAISRADFIVGVRQFLWFIPVGVPLALAVGFVSWNPSFPAGWTAPLVIAGNALGLYAAVALAEEMFFRGVLQNLLAARLGPPVALVIASLLFGLSHLGRGFPNWRYAVVAAAAGWFYGRAYAQRRSVVASSVTHTLVVLAHRYLLV